MPKSDSNTKLTKVYRERFHWPLAIAIACLLVETVLPERKKLQRPASAAVPSGTQAKKAVVSLCLLLLPLLAMASPSSALRQYNSGKYEAALDEYERLSERKTNDYRLHYNAGTSAYQAKQLEAAQKHLNAALNSPEITSDLITQQRAYYNLGNTEFQLGAPVPDTKKKKELWEQSIANYTRALQLDPKDTNANNNLAFVKRKLEELKQQQQQQKDNNGDSKDQEDKDQQKDQDQKGEQDKKDQKDQKEQKNQKQDDKQQQQNSQDQKSAKDQEQKKADQEKKKQQQAKKDKEKQEQKDQAAAEEKKEKSPEGSEQQEATVAGQMSLQQAKRILDAQQEDEKALIFRPENDPQKQQSQKLKDW